jgi:hypothetical protein
MPTAFKHKYLIKTISRTAIVTAGITVRVWKSVSSSREADTAQQILESSVGPQWIKGRARQACGQFVGHVFGKVTLCRVAGEVFQRQHGQGANRGRGMAPPGVEIPRQGDRKHQRQPEAGKSPSTGRRPSRLFAWVSAAVKSGVPSGARSLATVADCPGGDRDIGEKTGSRASDGLDEAGFSE